MILPKEGRRLPGASANRKGDYAELVAAALRAEFGDRRHTVKVIMRWTRASGRTVRYWLAAEAMPNGDHLVELIARSDQVLETVLAASRRVELLDLFIRMRAAPMAKSATSAASVRRRSDRVPVGPDDPGRVPDRVASARRGEASPLNDRQTWFVDRLAVEPRLGAGSLAVRFGVSERTAKRDIAGLKAMAEIVYVGNTRRGHYVSRTRSRDGGRWSAS